ncbi:TPA: serine acetyltransferase [Morganella morganii]|uniref:Serine acetyltransferase n=1 Tax=Morganella morganii TaxID=582 RepID=A0AAN5MF46_MORMO|nr:serine acetyltransferase [Morganella morganii]HED3888084.1 serine acetyltransferase [Morganella morganii]HEI9846188.1 serine acetyltransferase [Morganella morganii]
MYSSDDIKKLVLADFARYCNKLTFYSFYRTFKKNESFNFLFWFRLSNHKNRIIRKLSRFFYKRKCRQFNIFLPVETSIGGGLYIGHITVGGICINPTAIIGSNVNISHHLTIGSNKGKAAIIGNNVYIAPHVCIVEAVSIGHNVKIGAGAVVLSDIADNSTAVGVPARTVIK